MRNRSWHIGVLLAGPAFVLAGCNALGGLIQDLGRPGIGKGGASSSAGRTATLPDGDTSGDLISNGAPAGLINTGGAVFLGQVRGSDGSPAREVAVRAYLVDPSDVDSNGVPPSLVSNNSASIVSPNSAGLVSNAIRIQALASHSEAPESAAAVQSAGLRTDRGMTVATVDVTEGRTDASGQFVLRPKKAGTYNVEAVVNDANKAWLPGVVTSGAGTVNLGKLDLAPTGTIRGRVHSDLPGVSDYFGTFVFIPGSRYVALTQGDGSYELDYVPEGKFQLRAFNTNLGEAAVPSAEGHGLIQVEAGGVATAPDLDLHKSLPILEHIERPDSGVKVGNAAPGQEVLLIGKYFGYARGVPFRVQFQGTSSNETETTRTSDTSIRVRVPPGAASGPIAVIVGLNPSNRLDFRILRQAFLPIGKLNLAPGGHFAIGRALQAYDDKDAVVKDPFIDWATDSALVSVDASGQIEAKAPGLATLTGRAGTLRALRIVVAVTDQEPAWPCATASGPVISLVAGAGEAAPPIGFAFAYVGGLALDHQGALFVSDISDNKIYRVAPGGRVTTVAGDRIPGYADGPGESARFEGPAGLAVDASGDLFVADSRNNRIRRIDPSGLVSTFAGSGEPNERDGAGIQAAFDEPDGLAIGPGGDLFVTDFGGSRIRRVTPDGQVSTVAGGGAFSGIGGGSFLDGVGTTARFSFPKGLAADDDGNLFVADSGNNRIRAIAPDGIVTTLAGSGVSGNVDGVGPNANFNILSGLVAAPNGHLIALDQAGSTLRFVRPGGQVLTWLTFGRIPAMNYQTGLVTDGSGRVFVSTGNAVRMVCPGW